MLIKRRGKNWVGTVRGLTVLRFDGGNLCYGEYGGTRRLRLSAFRLGLT